MNIGRRSFAWCGVAAALFSVVAAAQSPTPAPAPPIAAPGAPAPTQPAGQGARMPVRDLKPLGNDRYQVGRIVVDKRAQKFVVPGRVHVLDRPLEYLATSPGGMKEYEALLELDASGSEFNLACILLGLERDPRQAAFYQFSRQPLVGPKTRIHIAWTSAGERKVVAAAEALLDPEAGIESGSVEWVYTGSVGARSGGRFAADVTGTLVGFVHDANSIIESVQGLGIGAYGSVSGNAAVLPPVGTAVELVVETESTPAR